MRASATDPPDLDAAPVNLKTTLRHLPLALPRLTELAHDPAGLLQQRSIHFVDPASAVPLGIVTLRDAVRAIADEDFALDVPVAVVMTGGLASLSADATVHQATVLMFRRGMRHLILTEADGRLFNIVSQGDLYGMQAADSASLADAILAAPCRPPPCAASPPAAWPKAAVPKRFASGYPRSTI